MGGHAWRQRETIVGDSNNGCDAGRFDFPVGYETFHQDAALNFLLNRTHSMGYARHEDMVAAGNAIESIVDCKSVMVKMAQQAAAENRLLNAAFYYRIAEFYVPWEDPDKSILYERFSECFYRGCSTDALDNVDIRYGGTPLPAIRVASQCPQSNGSVIVHAGYDGFKEELYAPMRFLSSCGYDVIAFDVPWMGRTRPTRSGGFDYRWERLIGAVIDHFGLEDVALFGLSFGGWLALRAAAFESRIGRVIASSVSFDVNQYAGAFARFVSRFARKNLRNFANSQILRKMESDPQMFWFFDHLMHVMNRSSPLEAADVLAEINEENLHSELVKQDVLILTGRDDHLVPFKMQDMQVRALEDAASVTPVVFTRDTDAQNHCQIGNFGLALRVVVDWLARTAVNRPAGINSADE